MYIKRKETGNDAFESRLQENIFYITYDVEGIAAFII